MQLTLRQPRRAPDGAPVHYKRHRPEQTTLYRNWRVQTNAANPAALKLKTAWRDGTTHLVMSPLEFMQRLHLIRFHGSVFAIDLAHCRNCGGELKIIAAILAGDREDPCAPRVAGQGAAPCAGARPGAASGLTPPNRDSSGDLVTRAAGVGCVREFAGPMDAARRQGATLGR